MVRVAVLVFALGGALAEVALAPTPPVPVFRARMDYAVPASGLNGAPSVAAADTNGDGIPDLVWGGGCGGVGVVFGNGDGTFRPGPTSAITGDRGCVADPFPIDLNGDGVVDLVAVGDTGPGTPSGIAVSFGNGDGTFQTATFYPTGSDYDPTWIVIHDFTGDGNVDIATESSSGVWLFTGRGLGLFNPGVLTPVPQAQASAGIAAVDLDRDGKMDLVAGAGTGFSVLLGNGDGTFRTPVSYPTWLRGFTGIVVADVNGDGLADVVGTEGSFTLNYSLIFPGKRDGTFGQAQAVNLPSGFSLGTADLNGDGIPDLFTSSGYIVYGKGNGKFTRPVNYAVSSGGNAAFVRAADLRNSGRPDLVFVNWAPNLSILLNKGGGAFEDGKQVTVTGGAPCGVSADFNRDGNPDLATITNNGVVILLGTGTMSKPFTQGTTIPITTPGCPVLGDVNRDGKLDLVLTAEALTGAGSVITLLGQGDGTFVPGPSSTIAEVGNLVLGDFNGDGKLDYASQSNLLGLGNGDGSFQTPAPFVPAPDPRTKSYTGIVAGKLNADGVSDIVMVDLFHNLLYVLTSNGAQGFTQTVINTWQYCSRPNTPAIGDVNGDHSNDLVFGCADFSAVPIFLNDGAGHLSYATSLDYQLPTTSGVAPLIRDVNGDGIADILVNAGPDTGVFTGEGGLTFAAPFYIGSLYYSTGILAANLHRQPAAAGKPDLVLFSISGALQVTWNVTP